MKKFVLLCALATTSFAGNGEEFFTNTSPMIWEGVDSVRFGQSSEKVIGILTRNIKTIETFANKFDVNKKLSVWTDSTSKMRYFNTTYIRRIDYQVVNTAKTGATQNDVTLGRIGLKTVYVGNRDSNFVLMAFTFYNGSKEFVRDVKSDYEENQSVRGLFSWNINMDGFKSDYLYHILEEVGYGRNCERFKYNCQTKDEDKAGGEITTKDKDTYISWRKDGELLNIRWKANYVSSFPKACKTNLYNWVRANEAKHPALD